MSCRSSGRPVPIVVGRLAVVSAGMCFCGSQILPRDDRHPHIEPPDRPAVMVSIGSNPPFYRPSNGRHRGERGRCARSDCAVGRLVCDLPARPVLST